MPDACRARAKGRCHRWQQGHEAEQELIPKEARGKPRAPQFLRLALEQGTGPSGAGNGVEGPGKPVPSLLRSSLDPWGHKALIHGSKQTPYYEGF